MLKGQEEHTHNHIHHHKNEIGVAISPVYFFGKMKLLPAYTFTTLII